MFNKIYLVLLIIAFLVMGALTFYSYSWLQSIGRPDIAVDSFMFYSNFAWTLLWISFIVLAIFSCVLIFKNGWSWSLWVSFVYFAIFMTLQTFWLAPSLQGFKEANNLSESALTFTPILGAMTIIVLAIATFFTQFITFRLRDKMVDKDEPDLEEVAVE